MTPILKSLMVEELLLQTTVPLSVSLLKLALWNIILGFFMLSFTITPDQVIWAEYFKYEAY